MSHPDPKKVAPVVLAVVIIGGGLWWFFSSRASSANGLTASGTIEATEINVNPELGGRVSAVNVNEGDTAAAGAVLVEFDPSLLQSQRAQAAAALAAAKAGYDSVNDGPAFEQLTAAVMRAEMELLAAQHALQSLNDTAPVATAQAQAAVANARDALDKAQRSLNGVESPDLQFYSDRVQDAQNALTNVQQNQQLVDIGALSVQLQAARDFLKDAGDRLGAIQTALAGSSGDPNRYVTVDRYPPLRLQDAQDQYNDALNRVTSLELQIDQANRGNATGLRDAQKHLDDAKQNLADAEAAAAGSPNAIRLSVAQANAVMAQANLDRAQDYYNKVQNGPDPDKLAEAQARVSAAEAALAAAKAAAGPDRLTAAQAQADVAQAALDVLDVQLRKLTLAAPIGGTVLSRVVEPGEVVSPGATLLVLADLSALTITVYLPEDRYGNVKVGEMAQVTVDSYPNETFTAKVGRIADQAEFTPRNVQTASGRKTTVYAVTLSINNPDGKLKPGMPADVSFGK